MISVESNIYGLHIFPSLDIMLLYSHIQNVIDKKHRRMYLFACRLQKDCHDYNLHIPQ